MEGLIYLRRADLHCVNFDGPSIGARDTMLLNERGIGDDVTVEAGQCEGAVSFSQFGELLHIDTECNIIDCTLLLQQIEVVFREGRRDILLRIFLKVALGLHFRI